VGEGESTAGDIGGNQLGGVIVWSYSPQVSPAPPYLQAPGVGRVQEWAGFRSGQGSGVCRVQECAGFRSV
jgi:hypothetical protein